MNLQGLHALHIPVVEHQYTFKDSILYALGLGYGEDRLDPAQLQFVYEEGQRVVPSSSSRPGEEDDPRRRFVTTWRS